MIWDTLGRRPMLIAAAVAAAAGTMAAGGVAVALAARPEPAPASAGRVLTVRYVVVREPAYAPPAPDEATRLDVTPATGPVAADPALAGVAADAAWREMQADADRRTRAAVAAIRAEDARIDRELAAELRQARRPSDPAPTEPELD